MILKMELVDDFKAGCGEKKHIASLLPQPSGLAGWLDDLKAKAEEIQREAEKPRGK
jgi:hypothetical protein